VNLCTCQTPAPGDPWDTTTVVDEKCPSHGPVMDMGAEEYSAIRDEVRAQPWSDPSLFPACLDLAMSALGEVAVSSLSLEDAERVTRNALRSMVFRAKNGCFPHEMSADV